MTERDAWPKDIITVVTADIPYAATPRGKDSPIEEGIASMAFTAVYGQRTSYSEQQILRSVPHANETLRIVNPRSIKLFRGILEIEAPQEYYNYQRPLTDAREASPAYGTGLGVVIEGVRWYRSYGNAIERTPKNRWFREASQYLGEADSTPAEKINLLQKQGFTNLAKPLPFPDPKQHDAKRLMQLSWPRAALLFSSVRPDVYEPIHVDSPSELASR